MHPARFSVKSRIFRDGGGYKEMSTERRTICCCDTKTWTYAIGVCQMIIGVTLISISSSNIHSYDEKMAVLNYNQEVIHNGTTIAIHVGSVLMGFVLIFGASKENLRCLLIWLIFNTVVTLVFVVNEIWKYMGSSAHPSVLLVCLKVMLHVSVQQYFMWVVNTFRREIKAQKGSSSSSSSRNREMRDSMEDLANEMVVTSPPPSSQEEKNPELFARLAGETVTTYVVMDTSEPSHFL